MPEVAELEIGVSDKVRIHFHPPNPLRSFSEGVVRRVDVATPQGRVFVVEVAHEVLLDREHRIRPGFQDHVLYDCRNHFPGRIQVLSTAEQEVEEEPAPTSVSIEPNEQVEHRAMEQPAPEPEMHMESRRGLLPGVEIEPDPAEADIEPQTAPRAGRLMAALFGRRE
jgi:hypothetical protein